MGTFLLLDNSMVPSDSITQELLKSVFGIFGNQKLTRLDSDHMCVDHNGSLYWYDLRLNGCLANVITYLLDFC